MQPVYRLRDVRRKRKRDVYLQAKFILTKSKIDEVRGGHSLERARVSIRECNNGIHWEFFYARNEIWLYCRSES